MDRQTTMKRQQRSCYTPSYITMGGGCGSSSAMSRRQVLRLAGLAVASICSTSPAHVTVPPAYALKPGKPSKEKLLNSLRDGKTPEELEEERERIAEERRQRLERQRELQAAAERRKAGIEADASKDTEIESNLRGQYYFPTARKRYLPRVKLAWDTLAIAEEAARNSRWREVSDMSSGVLTDAVLPMKLYASALAGGGLNISTKFIDKMTSHANEYEKDLKALAKAVKRKETSLALNTLTDMRGEISQYRELGRLQGDDFGIGEIASDNRVGSGFGNNNAALYGRNKGINASRKTTLDAIGEPSSE